jgi:hypothetical protein
VREGGREGERERGREGEREFAQLSALSRRESSRDAVEEVLSKHNKMISFIMIK